MLSEVRSTSGNGHSARDGAYQHSTLIGSWRPDVSGIRWIDSNLDWIDDTRRLLEANVLREIVVYADIGVEPLKSS